MQTRMAHIASEAPPFPSLREYLPHRPTSSHLKPAKLSQMANTFGGFNYRLLFHTFVTSFVVRLQTFPSNSYRLSRQIQKSVVNWLFLLLSTRSIVKFLTRQFALLSKFSLGPQTSWLTMTSTSRISNLVLFGPGSKRLSPILFS
jgi:hypothetical protein